MVRASDGNTHYCLRGVSFTGDLAPTSFVSAGGGGLNRGSSLGFAGDCTAEVEGASDADWGSVTGICWNMSRS